MTEQPKKAFIVYEKDPQHNDFFVTDARGGKVSENMYKITFYEEYPSLPGLEIIDLDSNGKSIPSSLIASVNIPPIDPKLLENLKGEDIAFVKRVEKTSITFDKEFLSRLKTWLNNLD